MVIPFSSHQLGGRLKARAPREDHEGILRKPREFPFNVSHLAHEYVPTVLAGCSRRFMCRPCLPRK